MATSSASALLKIQTFENDEADVDLPSQLAPGEWVSQADGILNSPQGVPLWNSGGWIQPIGTETLFNNRGPIGAVNYEGIPTTAVLTSLSAGVGIHDKFSWGDVSAATYLTMDVKGSFAGSGGISVIVHGDGPNLWSWTAAVSNEAVGANPGDVTEWTTILIPINRPTIRYDAGVFPSANGTEGHIDGSLEDGGNWGVNGNYASDAEMIAAWDLTMTSVDRIDLFGLTPDTQIDNMGFVLPDVTPGDFDSDNDIDGADFLAWQRGESPSSLSASDLADWESNFGTVAAVTGVAAVPEPSTVTFMLLASFGLFGARQRC